MQLKWAMDQNRHLSKDLQMTNKYIKTCSTSVVIMEIKTTMRQIPLNTHYDGYNNNKKKTNNNKYIPGCGEI